ncbi:hypothetical protein DFP72DRAFT_1053902 [Ephemerocybe angulata]|uniref:Uncharacterized protein n=1 Tax=Ephemerocybe angulata TaxID=980116 RepID=A0A8H6LVH1_9AGAR|nr:hypothetical protein DFP72DRAFT_1053902 [Tulosesus angulatus]
MKVTIPSILLGMLSLSTCAFAYLDYNELDARDYADSLLVERNTVEVPFQHSLRSFLEGAAAAYQRTLDDHDDLLEARANEKTHVFAVIHPFWNGKPVAGEAKKLKEIGGQSPRSWTAKDARDFILPSTLHKATCKFRRGAIYNEEILSLQNVEDGEIIILDCHK